MKYHINDWRLIPFAVALSVAGWISFTGSSTVQVRTPEAGVAEPVPDECFEGVVRYCIAARRRDGSITFPQPTDYWTGEGGLDDQGLPYRQGSLGRYRNVASIALSLYGQRLFDVNSACRGFTETPSSRAAHDWLLAKIVSLKGEAITWHYDYDSQVNDAVIKAPYASAFSQAAIIERLLLLRCVKNDASYLDLAVRAARAFDIPVSEGGLRSQDPEFTWFQEVPLPDRHNPFILNAHLYAIYALNLLHRHAPEEGFDRLAERGLQSLTKALRTIDNGYWTRYDLRPAHARFDVLLSKTDAVLKSLEFKIGDDASIIDFATAARSTPGNLYGGKYKMLAAGRGIIPYKGLDVRFVLPRGREFEGGLTRAQTDLVARIACCGGSLELSTLGSRPEMTEFFRLHLQSRVQDGGDEILTFRTGLQDAGWGHVAREYIPYHAALMAQVAFQARRPDLYLYALRWQGFYKRYSEDRAETGSKEATPLRDRHAFDPEPDLGAALFAAFEPRSPEDIGEAELMDVIERLYPAPPGDTCLDDLVEACRQRQKAWAALALRRSLYPTRTQPGARRRS